MPKALPPRIDCDAMASSRLRKASDGAYQPAAP